MAMNDHRLIFSPAALTDLTDAATWYNRQQKGLGKKFRADIKLTVASIKLNPYFASVKYLSFRVASCNRFPYAIHYQIDEGRKLVIILSIFHFSRKPYWLEADE